MKKVFITSIVLLSLTVAHGQTTVPDSTKKEFKNIIAIDATRLLRQFFNFNANSYFSTPYMISYKRICKNNAFRIGVGGNFYNNNGTTNDTLASKQTTNDFNVGIGFEHYCYLGTRWNFYFGADAIVNYRYNDYRFSWTASTAYRRTSTNYGYGVSPLLGLQFKINSRLSIATETSYDITYTTSKGSTTQTPPSSYDNHSKSTGIQTTFNAPTTINFRILF